MWEYRAALIRVIDADTITVLADTGFGGRQQEDVRLLDVSAPELNQPGGPEAKAFVADWMSQLTPLRWPLLIRTDPNTAAEPTERRSFVRYLATVWDLTHQSRCLNVDLRLFLAQHPEWGTGM